MTYIAIALIGILLIDKTVSFTRTAIKRSTFGSLVYKAKPTISEDIVSIFMLIASSGLMIYQQIQRRSWYLELANRFPDYVEADLSAATAGYYKVMALLIVIFIYSFISKVYTMLVGFKIYEEGLVTSKGSWYWHELAHFSVTEDEQKLLYIITKNRWFNKKHFFLKEECKEETYHMLAAKLERQKMDE